MPSVKPIARPKNTIATQKISEVIPATLALVGTTAQLYWQLGYLNQRLAANQSNIASAEKTLQLVQAQASAETSGKNAAA